MKIIVQVKIGNLTDTHIFQSKFAKLDAIFSEIMAFGGGSWGSLLASFSDLWELETVLSPKRHNLSSFGVWFLVGMCNFWFL
jgi:hypothetical protein